MSLAGASGAWMKGSRGMGDFQARNLFKSHHVIDEIGELKARGVAHDANAPLPERVHAPSHLREDVLNPAAYFGTRAVGRFLLLGQRVGFAALDVDVSAHALGAQIRIVARALIRAV